MGWGSDHLVQVSSPENVTVRVHLLILLFVSPRSEEGLRAKRAGVAEQEDAREARRQIEERAKRAGQLDSQLTPV